MPSSLPAMARRRATPPGRGYAFAIIDLSLADGAAMPCARLKMPGFDAPGAAAVRTVRRRTTHPSTSTKPFRFSALLARLQRPSEPPCRQRRRARGDRALSFPSRRQAAESEGAARSG